MVQSLSLTRDGKRLAASVSGNIQLWDLATQRLMREWRTSNEGSASIHPDGNTIACATQHFGNSPKGGIGFCSTPDQDASQWRTARVHQHATKLVAYSPDGKLLASASEGRIKLWHSAKPAEIPAIPVAKMTALVLSRSGGKTFVSIDSFQSAAQPVRVLNMKTGRQLRSFKSPTWSSLPISAPMGTRWLFAA